MDVSGGSPRLQKPSNSSIPDFFRNPLTSTDASEKPGITGFFEVLAKAPVLNKVKAITVVVRQRRKK